MTVGVIVIVVLCVIVIVIVTVIATVAVTVAVTVTADHCRVDWIHGCVPRLDPSPCLSPWFLWY